MLHSPHMRKLLLGTCLILVFIGVYLASPTPTLAQDALCFWISGECVDGGCSGSGNVPIRTCLEECNLTAGGCDQLTCDSLRVSCAPPPPPRPGSSPPPTPRP